MYFKIIRILNYFSDHDFDVARLRIYNLEKMGSYFSSHLFRILKNIKNQKFYPNLRIYSLEKMGVNFKLPTQTDNFDHDFDLRPVQKRWNL